MNGDCYFTRECEALGVPLIVTPIPSFEEQGLIEGKNCYYMPFDMDNINIERLLNIPSYEPYIAQDNWINILIKSKSKYKEELKMKFLVRATDKYIKTNTWDSDLSLQKGVAEYKPQEGEQWEVDYMRKEKLVELGFVTVVKEIKEVETAKKEVKTEKAVKKTTRKTTKKSK